MILHEKVSAVFARPEEDLLTSWVHLRILRHVIDTSLVDRPAVILCAMFCDLLSRIEYIIWVFDELLRLCRLLHELGLWTTVLHWNFSSLHIRKVRASICDLPDVLVHGCLRELVDVKCKNRLHLDISPILVDSHTLDQLPLLIHIHLSCLIHICLDLPLIGSRLRLHQDSLKTLLQYLLCTCRHPLIEHQRHVLVSDHFLQVIPCEEETCHHLARLEVRVDSQIYVHVLWVGDVCYPDFMFLCRLHHWLNFN